MPAKHNPQQLPSEFKPGEIVAERYRILGVAGSGPASTVYKAEDVLTAGTVALKLTGLSAKLHPASISSYRTELNVFRNCQHSHLIRIIDSGDYLGRIYVAMEWAQGMTLRDQLQAGVKFPFESFQRLYGDISDALAELHAQHVAHRDIHPGNIMCGENGRWKLMEFGVDRDQRRTRESPEAPYAGPEQIMGQRSSMSSDVYSIGAIAFHALLGRPPIRSGTSPVRVDSLLGGAPAGLVGVIETCLQLDPAKRFQNIQALRVVTDRILGDNQSAAARPLADWASTAPGEPAVLMPLFVRAARGLVQLHESGQDHGELSPKNIRIVGERAIFETRDVGVAPSAQATLLIADAKYTAPELVLARKAPDPEAHLCGDVYVLGFVFYELVVGQEEMRRQFTEAEQMQTGLAWMRWHSDPNSKLRPIPEVAPSCPRGLAELIEQMTRKNPADRALRLDEVAAALEKLTAGLARTQPFAIGAIAPKRRRNRRPHAIAVAAFVLIASALLARSAFPDRDWLGMLGSAWAGAKSRLGWGGSARAASFPATLQTSTGSMAVVPQGQTAIAAFYIDRTEVTNHMYRNYCATSGRALPEPPAADPSYFAKDDLPVVGVDLQGAESFCRAAGKRLPTEQEWERAAGGGETLPLLWGNWTLPGIANLKGDGRERPAKVGTFTADVSPFGMRDAAGNVREWVVADDRSGQIGIVKGGSFDSPPDGLSPSARTPLALDRAGVDLSAVGFRCAADVRAALAASTAR